MERVADSVPAPSTAARYRATPEATALLALAAVAWLGVIGLSSADRAMTAGGMALGRETLLPFMLAWTPMMAAMMLPSVAPVASLYARTFASSRLARIASFSAGYLIVWTATGLIAFALGVALMVVAETGAAAATAAGASVYAVCGLYQLSPLKERCLRHCRSPLSLLLHYGSYRGRLRDIRVGLHHGAYCLGCCWSLMLVLLAAGAMNVLLMLGVAAVVLAEKQWAHGGLFSRAVGVAALAAAVVSIWIPELRPLREAAGMGGLQGTGPG